MRKFPCADGLPDDLSARTSGLLGLERLRRTVNTYALPPPIAHIEACGPWVAVLRRPRSLRCVPGEHAGGEQGRPAQGSSRRHPSGKGCSSSSVVDTGHWTYTVRGVCSPSCDITCVPTRCLDSPPSRLLSSIFRLLFPETHLRLAPCEPYHLQAANSEFVA